MIIIIRRNTFKVFFRSVFLYCIQRNSPNTLHQKGEPNKMKFDLTNKVIQIMNSFLVYPLLTVSRSKKRSVLAYIQYVYQPAE